MAKAMASKKRKATEAIDRWTTKTNDLLTDLITGLSTTIQAWNDFCDGDLKEIRGAPEFEASFSKLETLYRELRGYEKRLVDFRTCHENERQRVSAPGTAPRVLRH